MIDVEIKSDPEHPDWSVTPKVFAAAIVGEVNHHWKGKSVSLRTFDFRVLEEIRKIDAEIPITALTPEGIQDYQAIAEAIKPQIIAPWKESISKEQVGWLKKMGIHVMPYTVNRKEEWAKFIEWGAYGVTTDDPRGLAAFLEEGQLTGTVS